MFHAFLLSVENFGQPAGNAGQSLEAFSVWA